MSINMTAIEARSEARRRWQTGSGSVRAVAYKRPQAPHFVVGLLGAIKGEGDSWEMAFKDAERKENHQNTQGVTNGKEQRQGNTANASRESAHAR